MKKTILKSVLFASLLVTGLSLTSCKKEVESTETTTVDTDTTSTGDVETTTTTTDTTTVKKDTVPSP